MAHDRLPADRPSIGLESRPTCWIIVQVFGKLAGVWNAVSWQWNGKYGLPARHDVIIWHDGAAWQVEDRHGGELGWSTTLTARDESDARTIAAHFTSGVQQWMPTVSRQGT